MANANELEDFNGHVGKCAEGFAGIHGGYGIKSEMEGVEAEGKSLNFSRSKKIWAKNGVYNGP